MLYNRNGVYYLTSSYSGSDMVVSFSFPNAKPVTIGMASTVSYSTFREKRQVRTLGRISAKGITKGSRTVGGTLIFTIIRQHVINDILEALKESNSAMYGSYDTIKPDELPPFDIVVTFANEYGQSASMVIYGCTIIDDNKTLSIEDIFTENTMTYIARDIDHMKDTTTDYYNSTASSMTSAFSAGDDDVSPISKVGLLEENDIAAYNAGKMTVDELAEKYRQRVEDEM